MASPQVVLPPEIAKYLPATYGLAKGKVEPPAAGWFRALYYDPITELPIKFEKPPTIVAITELREGLPPRISAPTIVVPTVPEITPTSITVPTIALPTSPTIDIPTMEIPVAPTIEIPAMELPTAPTIELPKVELATITLPKLPTVEVPEPAIDYRPLANLIGYRFDIYFPWPMTEAGDKVEAGLNKMMELWDKALTILISVVSTVNDGFKKARAAILGTLDSITKLKDNTQTAITDLRDKAQSAINDFRDKIQTGVNKGLSDTRDKTQTALNDYRDKIQKGINAGLADDRTKTQTALNDYRDKIQKAINAGLADAQTKTQNALNSQRDIIQNAVNLGLADARTKTQASLQGFRDNIQTSINEGLTSIIPTLYQMMGLPIGQLITPVQIRNVTVDSFEFYSLGKMRLHYIAIGKRAII